MSINDEPINFGEFFKAYTGIKFTINKEDNCSIFIPNYTNINYTSTVTSNITGTSLTFSDQWASQSFVSNGSLNKIDTVLLKQLWDYPSSNILWDDYKKQLSFVDVDVEEITLYDFVKNLDNFMVFHKLSRFGDVWWAKKVQTDGSQNTNSLNTNVTISTMISLSGGDKFSFWSPDKWLNDEYKKYSANPTAYSGFLTSEDFINGGWFNIPDMVVSTQPFEKLKMADILLHLNLSYEPIYFGHYYNIDNKTAIRIKDSTTSTVLDTTQTKSNQNNGTYSDTLIAHWVGGLVSTTNVNQFGELGTYNENPCEQKQKQINYTAEETNPLEISHKIDSQLSLNPDYDISQRDFLGTIDPINWISSEETFNAHNIGVLNEPRAFGRGSGTSQNGMIVGGIKTDNNSESIITSVLSSSEIWKNNGFLKNVLITTNSPRCYHIQGGTGSSSCAIIGGYSKFNTTDSNEFSEYSKDGILNNVEIFEKNENDPELSSFKIFNDIQLSVTRGDGAGFVNIQTQNKKDKFEISSVVKNYTLNGNDEQAINDFVLDNSEKNSTTDNAVRYSSSTVTGFIYCGNTTGKSYLINTANTGDITSIFEKINITTVNASTNLLDDPIQYNSDYYSDAFLNVVNDVITIDGATEYSEEIILEKCGKYRIEYINGGFYLNSDLNVNNTCLSIIDDMFQIKIVNSPNTKLVLDKTGIYQFTIKDSSFASNTLQTEVINDNIQVDSASTITATAGATVTLPYIGKYLVEVINDTSSIEFFQYPSNETRNEFEMRSNVQFSYDFYANNCGTYRIQYSDHAFTVWVDDPDPEASDYLIYFGTLKIKVMSVDETQTFSEEIIWPSYFNSDDDFYDYIEANDSAGYVGKYHEFCVEDQNVPQKIKVIGWDPYNNCEVSLTHSDDYGIDFYMFYMGSQNNCSNCSQSSVTLQKSINDAEKELFSSQIYFYNEFKNSDLNLKYINQVTTSTAGVSGITGSEIISSIPATGKIYTKLTYLYTNINTIDETNVNTSGSSGAFDTLGLNVYFNDIYKNKIFTGQLHSISGSDIFCNAIPGSEVTILGSNALQGSVVLQVCYLGCTPDCSSSSNVIGGFYNSAMKVFLNGNENTDIALDKTFNSLYELEYYLNSNPSQSKYDFCVNVQNSKLQFQNKFFTPNYSINKQNIRLLYLGTTDECDCLKNSPVDENLSISINYNTVNNELEYPVRCHGLAYVGDDNSGLSTGGRCEYNNINDVTSLVTNKYLYPQNKPHYEINVNFDSVREELEKNRILDLVYELKDGTWIRRQNLLESVYWHCGVGDATRSLFWGGIHDTTTFSEIDVFNIYSDIDGVYISDFLCNDDKKLYDVNISSKEGKDYTTTINTTGDMIVTPSISACWDTPNWKTNLNYSDLFDDPRYVNNQETLDYSTHNNYPEFEIISILPSSPTPISPQNNSTIISINTDIKNNILISKTFDQASFRIFANVNNNTTNGTIKINTANIIIGQENVDIFPTNIVINSIINQELILTDIEVLKNNQTKIYYTFKYSFIYNTTEFYELEGYGILLFNTLTDIYNSSKVIQSLESISHNFIVTKCSISSTVPITIHSDNSKLTFELIEDEGISIGVETLNQSWTSSLKECGKNISKFIDLNGLTPMCSIYPRWGTPIWTHELYNSTYGYLGLNFKFNYKNQTVDNDTSIINYETTSVNVTANTLGSILNQRILISGQSFKQNHIITNMSSTVDLTGSLNNDICEFTYPENSLIITFTENITSNWNQRFYTECASSITQEYQSDKRYNAPDYWIPSNSVGSCLNGGTRNSTQTISEKIAWKRYMDGTGLGGDVPDYETIYDVKLNKLKDSINWNYLKTWYIGQQCFGTATSAIIAGGHKIDTNTALKGINNGYHANDTTKRTFIWDTNTIPEEDSYNSIYLGRRLFNYYWNGQSIDSNSNNSSLSSLNVIIFNGESNIIVERQGTILFDGTQKLVSVKFDTPLPDDVTTYAISLTPSDNIKMWWSDKSNTGFNINCEIDNFKGYVDYYISSIVKATENDINNFDPLEGYNFDK
jgi:hypothetical protein